MSQGKPVTESKLTPRIVIAAIAIVSVVLLFVAPPIGFVAVAVSFILAPPWGKSLSERAVISGLVLLGIIALVFPRAGSIALDHTTARLLLGAVLLVAVGIGFLPHLRNTPAIPKPRWVDLIVAGTAAITAWSPIALYRGAPIDKVISGLYFSGWDNQGHFTTFANTVASQSTTWPTADGTIAWNQWYTALHTTAYSVMQQAVTNTDPNRLALVEPFAIWSALFFAASLAALVYVASDIARRWARLQDVTENAAAVFAAFATGAVLILGNVQNLYNAGFTNFLMATAITITASYLVAHSMITARTLGWFLVPLAAISVIGLWTPLALGLIPAGVITMIALLRWRKSIAIIWLVATAVGGAFLAVSQLNAILAGSEGASVAEFNEQIGQVGVGMAPFNLGLALAAPLLALLLGYIIWRHVTAVMAWSVAFPAIGAGVLALYFVGGTDAADLSRLASYYVLKSLDASLIMVLPLVVAAIAVAFTAILRALTTPQRLTASAAAALILIGSFGYVGLNAERMQEDFREAPGIAAGEIRLAAAGDELVGTAIVAAASAAQDNPSYVPLLWDGSGQLVNLWVGSLTNNMSYTQTKFYGSLPPFPYEDKALDYVTLAQNANPDLNINVLWFREASGNSITQWARMLPPQRVIVTQVGIPSSVLCPECTGPPTEPIS